MTEPLMPDLDTRTAEALIDALNVFADTQAKASKEDLQVRQEMQQAEHEQLKLVVDRLAVGNEKVIKELSGNIQQLTSMVERLTIQQGHASEKHTDNHDRMEKRIDKLEVNQEFHTREISEINKAITLNMGELKGKKETETNFHTRWMPVIRTALYISMVAGMVVIMLKIQTPETKLVTPTKITGTK